MRGTLKQRSKGSWSIILDLPRGSDGKRRQRRVTVKGTRKQAEAKQAELLHQINRGIAVDTGKLLLTEYLETWLRDVVAVRNRPRTVESYAVIVNNHIVPVLGHILLSKLQAADVQQLEAGLLASGLSSNTVRHVHIALSKAIKDAMRGGVVHQNVCEAVEAPSPGVYEVKAPDPNAIRQILVQANAGTYGAILQFMAFTGVRRGEAVGLSWQNVDLERRVVSIVSTAQRLQGKGIVLQPPKSAAGRRGIAIDSGTVDMLRAHRGKQLLLELALGESFQDIGLVFSGPFGGLLDPSVVTRNFKKLARKTGNAGVRLHDLRHGHASGLIRAGVHPRVVQERLGHASAAFTMQVYGHVAAGLQQEAANAFAELMAAEM